MTARERIEQQAAHRQARRRAMQAERPDPPRTAPAPRGAPPDPLPTMADERPSKE